MKSFEYIRTSTVEETCSALTEYGREARILAGGTDLLLELRRPDTKTPKAVVEKLAKVCQETFKDKGTIASFEDAGWVIENLGAKEAAQYLTDQRQRLVDLVKKAKIESLLTPK